MGRRTESVDEPIDDPLGDLSTVVHAAARLAEWVAETSAEGGWGRGLDVKPFPPNVLVEADTILTVWKRLKGRL